MLKSILKWLLLAVTTDKYRSRTYNYEDDTRYSGYWRNRGSNKRENWVWVEHPTDYVKAYVNIHQICDDFIITKSSKPSGNALEWVECLSEKDESRAIRILTAGYQNRGNLIVAVDR